MRNQALFRLIFLTLEVTLPAELWVNLPKLLNNYRRGPTKYESAVDNGALFIIDTDRTIKCNRLTQDFRVFLMFELTIYRMEGNFLGKSMIKLFCLGINRIHERVDERNMSYLISSVGEAPCPVLSANNSA